jgi:hypothetical protein
MPSPIYCGNYIFKGAIKPQLEKRTTFITFIINDLSEIMKISMDDPLPADRRIELLT